MPQLLRKLAQASYLDLQPKNLSTTILMWCDESNDLMWPGEGGFSAWTGDDDSGTWVSAANTIEAIDRDALSSATPSFYCHDVLALVDMHSLSLSLLLCRSTFMPHCLFCRLSACEWPRFAASLSMCTLHWTDQVQVGIEGALAHVGNTSFRGEFNLYRLNADGSAGALVAKVASVGVYVEKESLRPKPLPRREELLQHCATQPQRKAPTQHGQRPGNAYVWATAVRQTECDNLGHLNNTRYAMYGEDALGAAVYHGAFSYDLEVQALAKQPSCSVHISYIHEVKPFEPLFCAVWHAPMEHAFVVEMRTGDGGAVPDGGTLAAVVVLGVAAPPAAPRLPRL